MRRFPKIFPFVIGVVGKSITIAVTQARHAIAVARGAATGATIGFLAWRSDTNEICCAFNARMIVNYTFDVDLVGSAGTCK